MDINLKKKLDKMKEEIGENGDMKVDHILIENFLEYIYKEKEIK